MPESLLSDRLLRRELGRNDLYTRPKGLYGDKKWVQDLDIVNELDGHNGCVNALSWSKSGQLLASGSDDTRLNIHRYQPEHTDNPFALTTTVSTGHTANIFSTKFMPHSNDRTLITCAGDSEIRVFDLDYAGTNVGSGGGSEGTASGGIRYLSEADTNARVFRSHSDRVKRIVTESSPFLFLSCSEDGEVRQWDIRQPESTYPRPRSMSRYRNNEYAGDAPPPLISYKRYDLDLNTISCSPSQPHYIALGGAHMHCFLHDRRMLGRDILSEQGKTASSLNGTMQDDGLVSAATKCVRKFAPKGQQRMQKGETGHITACKISDANPNEMVVSWSGDWIYNFDLLRSPDVREMSDEAILARREKKKRLKEARSRKRKREAAGSAASLEGRARGGSKAKTTRPSDAAEEAMSLRVRYDNGQTEDVPVTGVDDEAEDAAADAEDPTPAQARRLKIAKTVVEIRKNIFSLTEDSDTDATHPVANASSFAKALRRTLSILEDMDEIMRTWRYPVDPDGVDVAFQNTLRSNRDRSRRFVQACGTVSRVLSAGTGSVPQAEGLASIDKASMVQSSPLERNIDDDSEQFCYDFLKAICLWLDSGPGALATHFAGRSSRRPLPRDASIDDIDEFLTPYLLKLASDRPIPNLEASRFEVDENRVAFETEKAAVLAFARIIKIPFADLSQALVSTDPSERRTTYEATASQDRNTALRYWGFKICRGVLMNAGQGINFSFVERAFGGLGQTPTAVRRMEKDLAEQLEGISSDDDESTVAAVGISRSKDKAPDSVGEQQAESREDRARRIHQRLTGRRSATANGNGQSSSNRPTVEEDDGSDEEMIPIDDVKAAADDIEDANGHAGKVIKEAQRHSKRGFPHEDDTVNADADEEDDDDDISLSSSESEEDEDEDSEDPISRNFLFRSAFARSSLRHKCNKYVPAVGSQLHYEGAANVRTVKDVNFYGLNDEYVVSGSDSGHFFIWDRASGRLLNILEGDGEVVNVVQGHPYEPMLAVSGIDHTIKVFGSDKRARENARMGTRINNTGHSGFSTLRMGGRTRFGQARRPPRQQNGDAEGEPLLSTSEPAMPEQRDDSDTETEEAAVAPNGLSSRRRMHLRAQITSQNDVERRGAGRETFITRGMLAQLAARMRMRQRGAAGEGEEGDRDEDDEGGDAVIEIDGEEVVIGGAGGDCSVQ